MLTLVLFAVLCDPHVLWNDDAKSRASFVPEPAFASPSRFGLSKAVIAEISADLDRAQETIEAINDSAESLGIDKSNCSTANPENFPEPTVAGTGEIVQLIAGWNRERQQVSTLACITVREAPLGEVPATVLVELPFGNIRVGRTTWCTQTIPPTSFKVGQKVRFSGTSDPHNEGLIVGTVTIMK